MKVSDSYPHGRPLLCKEIDENTFVSPLSVYSALSLVLVGSGGKSRDEMLAVLKLTTQGQDFDAIIRAVGEGLQKVPEGDVKNTLVLANSVFVDGSMPVLPAFYEKVKTHFKGQAQEVWARAPLSTFSRLTSHTPRRRLEGQSILGLQPTLLRRLKNYFPPAHSMIQHEWS